MKKKIPLSPIGIPTTIISGYLIAEAELEYQPSLVDLTCFTSLLLTRMVASSLLSTLTTVLLSLLINRYKMSVCLQNFLHLRK